MLVTEARDFVLTGVLNARSKDFSPYQLDTAMLIALDYMARRCDITLRQSTTVATVTDTATVSFATPRASNFLPQNLKMVRHSVTYDYRRLQVHGDFEYLRALLESDNTGTGEPEHIAFETDDLAYLWPIPDAAYTLTCTYTMPVLLLTDAGVAFEWVPGTMKRGTINIEDRFIREALSLGASAHLVGNEKGNVWASANWARFEAFVRDIRSHQLNSAGPTRIIPRGD